jgi:predicted nucleic acid-binding protein
MRRYLIDTNHASRLITYQHPLSLRIVQNPDPRDEYTLIVPVIAEVIAGIATLPRAEENLRFWAECTRGIRKHAPTPEDGYNAGLLQAQLRKRGWQLATIDALIATYALRNQLTLLTTDADFSRVEGLSSENWLRAF